MAMEEGDSRDSKNRTRRQEETPEKEPRQKDLKERVLRPDELRPVDAMLINARINLLHRLLGMLTTAEEESEHRVSEIDTYQLMKNGNLLYRTNSLRSELSTILRLEVVCGVKGYGEGVMWIATVKKYWEGWERSCARLEQSRIVAMGLGQPQFAEVVLREHESIHMDLLAEGKTWMQAKLGQLIAEQEKTMITKLQSSLWNPVQNTDITPMEIEPAELDAEQSQRSPVLRGVRRFLPRV